MDYSPDHAPAVSTPGPKRTQDEAIEYLEMMMGRGFFKGTVVVLLSFVLTACGGGGSGSGGTTSAPATTVTGVVWATQVDAGTFARRDDIQGVVSMLARWVGRLAGAPAQAAVTGLVPVAGATVELVRLDPSTAAIVSILATTTSLVDGSYTFTNTPLPTDGTLAVRVVGQTNAQGQAVTMRAIVTGSQVDVTPISEAVTQTVVQAGSLANFVPREVAALDALVAGMQVDLKGQPFDTAVTTLKTASSPIVPDMAAGMAANVVAAQINDKGFGLVGLSLGLTTPNDPGGRGVTAVRERSSIFINGLGFVENRRFGGFTSGSLFQTRARHDLVRVGPEVDLTGSLGGLLHIATSRNQLLVGQQTGVAVGGGTTASGDLLIYPSETTDGSDSLMLGVRIGLANGFTSSNFGKAQQVSAATLDDPLDTVPTDYHAVGMSILLSGPVPASPGNRVAFEVRHGDLSLNAAPAGKGLLPDNTVEYYPFAFGTTTGPLETSRIEVVPTPGGATVAAPVAFAVQGAEAGRFGILGNAGLIQMIDAQGGLLGQGILTTDGGLIAYYTASNVFSHRLDVLANDDEVAGRPLTITAVTQPAGGGSVSIAPDGRSLIYVPAGTGIGTAAETFSYTVGDGTAPAQTVGVTVDLVSVDAPPVARPDGLTVPAATTAYRLDVLANDSDAVGDRLCIASVVSPTAAGGTVKIASTGDALLYTNASLTGTDTVSYSIANPQVDFATGTRVCPATGVATATATLTPGTPPAPPPPATAPLARADAFTINVDDRAGRGLTIAARRPPVGTTLGVADLAGTFSVVEYLGELQPTGTTAAIGERYRYGTIVLDGTGVVTSADLFSKGGDLTLGTTATLTSGTTTNETLDPATPAGYTVAASGEVTMNLKLAGGEAQSARGFVTASGDFVALAVESSDSVSGRLGRGLLLMTRQ